MSKMVDIDGHRVYVSPIWNVDENFLRASDKVTSDVENVYFCKSERGYGLILESSSYDRDLLIEGRLGLAITIRDPSGEVATQYVSGTDNVEFLLRELGASPENLSPAKGRKVTAYKRSIALYGISVPEPVTAGV